MFKPKVLEKMCFYLYFLFVSSHTKKLFLEFPGHFEFLGDLSPLGKYISGNNLIFDI